MLTLSGGGGWGGVGWGGVGGGGEERGAFSKETLVQEEWKAGLF